MFSSNPMHKFQSPYTLGNSITFVPKCCCGGVPLLSLLGLIPTQLRNNLMPNESVNLYEE